MSRRRRPTHHVADVSGVDVRLVPTEPRSEPGRPAERCRSSFGLVALAVVCTGIGPSFAFSFSQAGSVGLHVRLRAGPRSERPVCMAAGRSPYFIGGLAAAVSRRGAQAPWSLSWASHPSGATCGRFPPRGRVQGRFRAGTGLLRMRALCPRARRVVRAIRGPIAGSRRRRTRAGPSDSRA